MSLTDLGLERLSVRLITQAGFSAYGDVVTPGEGPSRPVNDGRATRYDGVAALAHDRQAATPAFALYRIRPSPRPLRLDVLERHPRSSQVFAPLIARPYVVAVAPDDAAGGPALDRLEAFVVWEGVGVHYKAGVWHMPMVALDQEALFAMWMWEAGDGRDTEEFRLEHPRLIEF